MTANKRTVDAYMEGFRRTDRAQILSCLTEDVRWHIPGAFSLEGKDAFNRHIVDDNFVEAPDISVTRMTEENDVVVAEGSVRTERKDGSVMTLVFCDVFEMRAGKVARLTSYLMETK